MAGVTPFSRYLFFGLWMAFIGLIGLYWYSVTLAGSLINDIEQLHQQVTDANATIDELRYELRGPAGCVTLNDETKKHKKSLEESLPGKEKAIPDKTAAATKAEENLKTVREEHQKANATYYEAYTKLVTYNTTCVATVHNVTLACEAERNRTALQSKSSSLLGKLFGA